MTERKWEQCKTCHFCVETRSHPWVDKKSIMNVTGYACVVGVIMDNPETVHANWDPEGIQCELWTERNSVKITCTCI